MKRIKLFLIRFIARKHIAFITEQDVLRIVNRNLYLGDSKLSDEEIGILKEESGALLNSMLWKFMKRNVEYLATVKMGKQARNTEDIIFGNAMFHNLFIIEEFLNKIEKL